MARDSIEAAGLTDAGNVRQFNEDSIAIDPDLGMMALADGMGGHRAGDVASRMAAELIHAGLRVRLAEQEADASQHFPLLAVQESINRANTAIYNASQGDSSRQGMGTTLALTLFFDSSVVLGHIGDSRIYRMRAGRLELLTRDDSLLRDQVDMGLIRAEDAGQSHNRNLVTQALGVAENVPVHLRVEPVTPGDVFLLCSDGLNDLVDHDDIELIVRSLEPNLPLAAHTLVQAAKDNGGYDNVSVILARVRGRLGRPGTGWWARATAWLRRKAP